LDSLRTEMRSIIKIKDYLTRNQRLIPDIRENDKTPSWDGEIFVYSNDSIAKKDIAGKVAVQIKGSAQEDLSKKTIKYTLDCSDFRNYLNSNGAIVFVVYMRGYDDCKIYYNAFLPFDLIKLIENMEDQKTKTIELKEFPKEDSIQVINVFLNFIRNRKLQGSSIDRRLLTLSDVDNLGIEIDRLYFGYTGIGLDNITDAINYSLRNPTYIYAQPKGFNIKVPVEKINVEQILSDIKAQIIIENNVVYDGYKVLYRIGEKILEIGKSFKFNLKKGTINYKLSGTLFDRIKDLKFLLALFYNKRIKINGMLMPPATVGIKFEDIKKLEDLLHELEEIRSTLDVLGVVQDLEFDNLTDKELYHIFLLVKSILHNETVPLSLDNKPGIGNLTIGNISIKLICGKMDDGKYKLSNYFGNHNLRCTFETDGKVFILSPYVILNKYDFLTLSNINYSRIVASIKKAPKSKPQDEYVNQLVLEMLKAYDEQKNKNDQLLKTALEILEWLLKYSEIDSAILTLNKLQIIRRMRALSINELQDIYNIKSNTRDEAILTGASILLESFIEAKLYYDNLPEDRRKEFDNYPITNLWVR